MNHIEFLDRVARSTSCAKLAIRLALEALSDEQIVQRRELAQKLAKTTERTKLYAEAGSLGVMLLALGLLLAFTKPGAIGDPLAVLILSIGGPILVALFALIGAVSWLQWKRDYAGVAEFLAPIANTVHCATGLIAMETGGPRVQAWRDEALRQRSQLYVFDIEIMEALRCEHVELAEKADSDAVFAEACRKLHNVAAS